MKKSRSQFYLIFAFVLAQIAWLGLLGLWIYWYVSNYLILEKVGNKLSPQIGINSPNILVFVGGIILIVGIAFVMSVFFRNLTVQMKVTRLYDNFIANITHELKSPLSSVQLYLETLINKDVPTDKQKEFYSMMTRDTGRLKKLIDSILEISRLEQKRIAHDYYIYNADNIIHEMVRLSADQFKLPESAVKITGKSGCKCVIDKEAIQIVFDNLTDNALKYSINPVEILVRIYKTKKWVKIEFADKGIGIAAKDQKKIFNKFHRLADNNAPNVKGTGLGLYWVREIIKYHGGRIKVQSSGLNKGTNFIIELPVYPASKKYFVNSLLKLTARKQKMTESGYGG